VEGKFGGRVVSQGFDRGTCCITVGDSIVIQSIGFRYSHRDSRLVVHWNKRSPIQEVKPQRPTRPLRNKEELKSSEGKNTSYVA